eukprot:3131593-Amphidinium_carterae.1
MSSSIWRQTFGMRVKALDLSATLADNEAAGMYCLPNVSAVRTGLVHDTTWFPPVWTGFMPYALRTLVWRSDRFRTS